jgi:ubiquinone/menaquinone biosynthesis C-methylase UbiE
VFRRVYKYEKNLEKVNRMQNQKIKEGIKNTFDDVAEKYDNNKQFIISAKKMVEIIELENDELKILDLSTGTGNIAIELAKKFPKATIYGVDISSEMLKYAEEKTAKENLTNISYHLQDVEKLDFDGMQFDIITCGYGLFFYPQMEQVFCDVCSKLKTGSKFVFSTFRENAFQPYSKIFLEMLEKNYNISAPKRLEKKQLQSEEEIAQLSSLVPYQNLQIHPIDIRFAMSIDEWWKLLNSTGYQGLLNQLGQNYPKFEQEYLEHLHSLHNDGNIEFNADSFVSIVSV